MLNPGDSTRPGGSWGEEAFALSTSGRVTARLGPRVSLGWGVILADCVSWGDPAGGDGWEIRAEGGENQVAGLARGQEGGGGRV